MPTNTLDAYQFLQCLPKNISKSITSDEVIIKFDYMEKINFFILYKLNNLILEIPNSFYNNFLDTIFDTIWIHPNIKNILKRKAIFYLIFLISIKKTNDIDEYKDQLLIPKFKLKKNII